MLERFFDKIRVWQIVATALALALMGMNLGVSVQGDDVRYVLMARTFANNGILRTVMAGYTIPGWSYYFMLPLLLTPFMRFAPDNYFLMNMLPLSALVLVIIILNLFLRWYVTNRQRKMILLLFALNPFIIELSGLLMTDMPYLLILLLSLVVYKMYEITHARGYLFLCIAAAGCSLYLRPVAFALCSAILIHCIFKKRIKECFFCAFVLLIFVIPLLVFNGPTFFKDNSKVWVEKQEFYTYQSRTITPVLLAARAGHYMLAYVGNYLPDVMMRPIVEPINPRLHTRQINPIFIPKFFLGVLLGGIIILGFSSTYKRSIELFHFYVFVHLAMIFVINVYIARYLLSMWPILLIFFVVGLNRLVHMVGVDRKPMALRVSYLAVIFLVCVSLFGNVVYASNIRRGIVAPEIKSFVECNNWVKAYAARGAVILTRKPEYTNLVAGLPVVGFIFSKDPEEQMRHIKEHRVRYAIVSDLGYYQHEADYVRAAIQKYPQQFSLVYTSQTLPNDRVYECIGQR